MPYRSNPSFTDAGPCAMALLDARFVRWLARLDEGESAAPAAPLRGQVGAVLARALDQAGLRRPLRRVYWYSESDDRAVFDDQALRLVPAEDEDGGALIRQMSADMAALVRGGRVDVLIIGSDDDRLTAAIEEAKLAGVTLCLLADERAQTMPRLMQQDPNWARLLREADRRLVVRSADWTPFSPGEAHAAAGSPELATGDAPPPRREMAEDGELHGVVQGWWADLPADDQNTLRDELPALRGLPPEVDRELLLRGKNALGRALNFHEKRILRSHARAVALGEGAAGGDLAGRGPSELVELDHEGEPARR